MANNRLVLKDGTQIEGGFASRLINNSGSKLMVRVPGKDVAANAILFSDPNKTEEIICYTSVYKYTYTGYTQLYSIQCFEEDNYIEMWFNSADGNVSYERHFTVPLEYLPKDMTNQEDSNNE